ncbi:hypothetical protein Ancab_035381 [Ancistrocladus abbreviatus]
MEKPNKPKNNLFLKYLPKAASAVSFQNPIFSPGRDKRSSVKHGLGFSGPIMSMIPEEARRKPKHGSSANNNFDVAQEPTSPKVSCIGQIKLKHKKKKRMIKKISQPSVATSDQHRSKEISTKQSSKIHKTFGKSKSDIVDGKSKVFDGLVSEEALPSLGMMKKFASGRETLGSFEWTAEIQGVDNDDHHDCDYQSDHGGRRRGRGKVCEEEDDEEKEVVIVPHSAPILMGKGGVALEQKRRKEVNLWKRSMASPPPLHLNQGLYHID